MQCSIDRRVPGLLLSGASAWAFSLSAMRCQPNAVIPPLSARQSTLIGIRSPKSRAHSGRIAAILIAACHVFISQVFLDDEMRNRKARSR